MGASLLGADTFLFLVSIEGALNRNEAEKIRASACGIHRSAYVLYLGFELNFEQIRTPGR